MKNILLACAAVGALGLAATATPASSAPIAGFKSAPAVESNKLDARCWHRRKNSKWRCSRGVHKRWESRRHWHRRHDHGYRPYYREYYPFPFSLFRL